MSTEGPSALAHITAAVLRLLAASVSKMAPEKAPGFVSTLPEGWQSDPDLMVPRKVIDAAWERAVDATKAPALGLEVAAAAPVRAFGLLSYVAASSATLREAYMTIITHANLMQRGAGQWTTLTTERGVLFRFELLPPIPRPAPHIVDFVLGTFARAGNEFVGGYEPCAVRMSHPLQVDSRRYAEVFRCPVSGGHATSEIEVRASDLDSPLVGADPRLRTLLEELAASRVVESPETTAEQVRRILTKGLGRGDQSADGIAKRLALSPRSLRRRLAAEGTSLSTCMDEVRFELAKRYLADPRLSAADISLLLGFTEAKSFYRAFSRWAGVTLAEYRQRR